MELDDILEMQLVTELTGKFLRSPQKITTPHVCDAEIIDVYPDREDFLAITTDTISEEIHSGLYSNPYTIGWMAVLVNVSDLAAVGAYPLGLVLALSLKTIDSEYSRAISQGISDACQQAKTYVLGGDTNVAPNISITGTAIGLVKKDKLMTRHGMQVGDTLFVSGKLGLGNGLGISKFIPKAHKVIQEQDYLPSPRLREASIVREYASTCIDTSDGLFSAIAQLVTINHVGMSITADFKHILEERSLRLCQACGIPPFVLLAGIHGEFELLFSIPASQYDNFLSTAYKNHWNPIKIGKCVQHGVWYTSQKNTIALDVVRISNLFHEATGDLNHYINELVVMGAQIQAE